MTTLIQHQCPVCRLDFQPRRKEQRFCGTVCQAEARRKIPRLRKCVICGAEFKPRYADHLTCGNTCGSLKAHRDHPRIIVPDQSKLNSPEARAKKAERFRGTRNPMYGRTGAANPAFTTGEYAGVKHYRQVGQTGVCADCGATAQANGRRLSVHHEDRDRTNNDPANLTTLCQACHVKRHHAAGDLR